MSIKEYIKEFIHLYLPPSLKRALRKILLKKQTWSNSNETATLISQTPLDDVDEKFIKKMFKFLDKNLPVLLQVREVRQILARERLSSSLKQQGIVNAKEAKKNATNTIDYNKEALIESVEFDRPSILINPILSIERIYKNAHALRVLSIGPRSEIEIFSLFSKGFKLENIKAIDLISYSPYVEIGDMHHMPYKDNSFDVILLGWVISYSKDWAAVRDEILRCAAPRCVVAIAADYSQPTESNQKFNHEETHVQHCDQLLDLFSQNIQNVYFKHSSEPPQVAMNMAVFDIHK